MNSKKRFYWITYILFFLSFLFLQAAGQVCGTPGKDGVGRKKVNSSDYFLNTYFSPSGEMDLPAGSRQIRLDGVRRDLTPVFIDVEPGDLLLIIQMQDATIHASNDVLYGGNSANSGPDQLGGTGYTDLGNTGKYEYVVATNSVPATGGVLNFIGSGSGRGTVNNYVSSLPTPSRGTRTFQVVRIPQFSNILNNDFDYGALNLSCFNGRTGGIYAIHVAQMLDLTLSGFYVGQRGFRPGYKSDDFRAGTAYTTSLADGLSLVKGEGIAGTPRYTTLGVYPIDQGFQGLPMGDYGRGAAGNAGGGGAGGGGGGNGGAGGRGGGEPGTEGRPGSAVYRAGSSDFSRLIMGGAGGGGDSQYLFPTKGHWQNYPGLGAGIILIHAGSLKGDSYLFAQGIGTQGDGGGAGGTIFLNVMNPYSPLSSLKLEIDASGGPAGDKTAFGYDYMPGLGGGGGGGQVFHNLPPGIATINVKGGTAGRPRPNEPRPLGEAGQDGNIVTFKSSDLPPYLRMGTCYPELSATMEQGNAGLVKHPGDEVTYVVKTRNAPSTANAAGVRLEVQLPSGFTFSSATAAYTGYSAGPDVISNLSNNPNRPLFGDFIFFSGDEITLTIKAKVACSTAPGTYHSSAQALYLDPTRTVLDSNRRVSPLINAFQDTQTRYETGSAGNVPGSNYDGNLAASTADDVVIKTISIENNVISIPPGQVICISGNPGLIAGTVPTGIGAGFSYQWQQSADHINFTDISGEVSKDLDPAPITVSTYYRRQVFSLGCISATSSSNVVFFKVLKPLPIVDFELPDICLKDGTAIFKNKTVIEDDADLTYLWDFGDAENSTSNNPNHSSGKDGLHKYVRTGHYNITLTVYKEGSCPTILSKEFTVNGSIPKADFSLQNTVLCSGETLIFEDKASVDFGEITRIEWYFDAGNAPGLVEIEDHPQKRSEVPARLYPHTYPMFRSPGVKPVNVRMVVYSGTSCVDEVTKTIHLNAVPEVRFDVIPPICQDADPVQLTQGKEIWGIVSGSGKYSGSGVTENGVFSPSIAGVGSHQLNYTYVSDNGCVSVSKTQTITVLPKPLADAGEDQVLLEGGQVQLGTALNPADLSYKWSPPTGLNRDDVPNPLASPDRDIIYKLKVMTNGGCAANDEVSVRILRNPEIPNAFSPNGDHINDEWNIKYLSSYPNATITVFNRYGQKVFSSTSVGSKNWDGKYEGRDVPVGVYYYVIDPHNGRKIISGSLTLLR
ncbi:gliding motility-associated C-terminal domain-containing protein [Pedobacter sp. FW305-3-2-15-E-R2A2]|uniref:T9SS type B sorting domain-containing protein n=1 Tax=Pedobacter sp. FW305-3-2-15-E-R2A2 TaxID=3140251 RepID=UPI0031403124